MYFFEMQIIKTNITAFSSLSSHESFGVSKVDKDWRPKFAHELQGQQDSTVEVNDTHQQPDCSFSSILVLCHYSIHSGLSHAVSLKEQCILVTK